MARLLSACLALLALAPAAAAQPADRLLAEAQTRFDAGHTRDAYRLVTQGLTEMPDDPALLTLQLELAVRGVGLEGVPVILQRQQQTDYARRLLAVDPGNTLVHSVLGQEALRNFLFFYGRSNINFYFYGNEDAAFSASGTSPEYLRSRYLSGRFNVELLSDDFIRVDASGPSAGAGRDARAHFDAALASTPTYRPAYEPLVSLNAATGDWTAAAATAARAEALFPDWGEPRLWAALAQFRGGDAAGAEAVFDEGLARLDAAGRARYEDIADLLTPTQQAAYHAGPEAFARAFWVREDVRLLTPANERRAEHYARRTEADLLFKWSRENGVETPRGRVWARYGAPRARTQFSGTMYGPPKPLPDPYDVWEYAGFQMVFEDPGRMGGYQVYVPPMSALSGDPYASMAAERDDYQIVSDRMQRENPQRSQYAPARRERVPFLATAFRGTDGRAEVVVAFGVPLAAQPAPGTSARLAVETGVFVLRDGAALPVAERRRERTSLPASETIPLGEAAVWVGAETLRLAPGAYTLAAEFSAPGDVAGFERGPITVPAFMGRGLELSGLLLASSAEEGAAGPLVRRGVGIVPAPLGAVRGRVSVYAEAYGLALRAGQTDYEVALALVPEDGRGALGRLFGRGRRGGVSTASEGQGTSADEAVVLSLDVSGQRAGAYVLALRVTDRVSGAVAETSRPVIIE